MTTSDVILLLMLAILTGVFTVISAILAGRIAALEKRDAPPAYTPPPLWTSHTITTKTKETPSYARPTERQPRQK